MRKMNIREGRWSGFAHVIANAGLCQTILLKKRRAMLLTLMASRGRARPEEANLLCDHILLLV